MHSSYFDAVDLDRVVERVERALGRVGAGSATDVAAGDVEVEAPAPASATRSRPARSRRTPLPATTCTVAPATRTRGIALGRHVLERRRRVLERLRQRDPELQAVAAVRPAEQLLRRALGVDDAAPGRHPVDRAGLDPLHDAGRVAVHDRALEQVGERRQADVRMRPHVVVGAGRDVDRPEVVEEDERADGAPVGRGQQAAHDEAAAEVARRAARESATGSRTSPDGSKRPSVGAD